MIQPHSMADDCGREAVAEVRVGWRLHALSVSSTPSGPQTPVTVTRPPGDIRLRRLGIAFYFPLGSSLLISIVLSLALSLILWLFRR